MSESYTSIQSAPQQAPIHRPLKGSSERTSHLEEALALTVLQRIGVHKRSLEALLCQLVKVDKSLTRGQVLAALRYLAAHGRVVFDATGGVCFIVPVQRRKAKGGAR